MKSIVQDADTQKRQRCQHRNTTDKSDCLPNVGKDKVVIYLRNITELSGLHKDSVSPKSAISNRDQSSVLLPGDRRINQFRTNNGKNSIFLVIVQKEVPQDNCCRWNHRQHRNDIFPGKSCNKQHAGKNYRHNQNRTIITLKMNQSAWNCSVDTQKQQLFWTVELILHLGKMVGKGDDK